MTISASEKMTLPYHRRFTPAKPVAVISSSVWQALHSGADKAAERLAADTESAERVRNELDFLAKALYRRATDGNGGPVETSGVSFSRELIDSLRTEFLSRLNEDRTNFIDADEVLAVLSAMEEMANASDRANSGVFEERLASSDALRAVLEVAHDMRSPLSAILFLVETMRAGRSGSINHVQEQQLGLIYGAAFGLSNLASDIIEAARGNLLNEVRDRPFSVSEMLDEIASIVAPMAEEKGLKLAITYPTLDTRVGHVAAIHRVMLNLTSNALKYTDKGSVAIGCTETMEDTQIEFWVQDTGKGIPEKVLDMLFAGFRPGSVGVRFSSAGLGLAICKALLERMQSTLRVDTAPDKGTRFSFTLDLPTA
ncbi:MAG TPA: HAMP domain-containing sensor histidine kinase [Gemmatimonadaceae bacterium]|nr:HAMP domain-containing sensor histidine kinase [Gemmatimonadaceae bacterium]